MRVCLMFGVIVSAALYMPNSRDYAEFHAYLIDFVQGAAVWASVAAVARAVWRVGNERRKVSPIDFS